MTEPLQHPRVALAARVSISDKNQDPEVQLVPMREFSARRGWMVVDEYVDYARAADLMRTVISIREGRVSSVVLPRRLSNDSKKNRLYRAFRELSRVVRTIVLLRYLSEPELREGITAITNRAEAFHGFSKWLTFGLPA